MDIEDTLARYDLRDTQALMDDLARSRTLYDGTTLLVLIHQPAGEQRILAVHRLPPLGPDQGWSRALSDWLCAEVWRLEIPRRSESSASTLVTVICRRGTNGWGPMERTWALAWRYSNHNSEAFDRDIIVVTEHGWCSLWSETGGLTPSLRAEAA